jgi:hypothetical protein
VAVGRDLKGKLSVALYITAVGLSFLSQWMALCIYVMVALIWLVPDRRVGILMNFAADDLEAGTHHGLRAELHKLGWTVGHNLQIDYRFGEGDAERYRRFASELVALAPRTGRP